MQHNISLAFAPGGGGGGLNKTSVYTGKLHSEVKPLILLYTIFHEKRDPFCTPSIDKWYPFHILCLEVCIPNRTFSRLYKDIKFFWALEHRP